MSTFRWLRLLTVAGLVLFAGRLGADEPVKAPQKTYLGKTAKQWAARLTDKEWGERWWAAHALAEIGPPAKDAVPDLIKALKDPEHFVRGAAARALGSIGPAAVDALPALAAMLEDPSYVTHPHALKALRLIGPVSKDAAELFVRQLCDEDVKIRNNSLEAFRRAGKAGKPAVPALIALFKAKKDREKLYVAQALLAIGPAASEAASVLSDYMADNHYLIATLKKAGGPLILSPNGKILATSGEKGVMLWDVGTWTERATLAGAAFPAFFSPNGKLIATAGGSRKVKIWDTATGKEGTVIESDEVVGFNSDSTALVTSTFKDPPPNETIVDAFKNGLPIEDKLWDVATGKELATPKNKEGASKCVVVRQLRLDHQPGGPRKQTLELELGKGAIPLDFGGPEDLYVSTADGKKWASVRVIAGWLFGHRDNKITLSATKDRKESVLETGYMALLCLVFSPDGQTLLCAGSSHPITSKSPRGTLTLWDAVSAKEIAEFYVAGESIDYLAFNPEGNILFIGAKDGIQLWDAVKLLRRKTAKRSTDEREAYEKLWADVADFLRKVQEKK
jgi:HEAT repeat protein